MRTPIRIIVAADFKGTENTPRIVRTGSGKTNELLNILRPQFLTLSGQTYRIKSMDDFLPNSIRAQLDLKSNAEITAVLHDKVFQQTESSWRGLDFLISKLPEEGVVLEIMDASFENLRRRFLDLIVKPEHDSRSDFPATIVLGDYDFSYKSNSFDLFKDLSMMAESITAPFVAQTGADFFNLKHLLHLPTIKDPLSQIASSKYAHYHEFRSSNAGFWASLMINRFLLREPYNMPDYQEPAEPSKPEQYLFGRAIWILGANLIKSFSTRNHLIGISGLGTGGEQLDIPCRELPLTRTEKVKTPLEASLPIDIIEGLPYLGLSPLSQIPSDMGGQNQPGMIYLHLAANMHHIPDPENKQFGLLTVETSLAYSLMIGRISNIAYRLTSANAGKKPIEIAALLQSALLQDIWTKESDEIKVTLGDNFLKITYCPHLVIHTRTFSIELDIPL